MRQSCLSTGHGEAGVINKAIVLCREIMCDKHTLKAIRNQKHPQSAEYLDRFTHVRCTLRLHVHGGSLHTHDDMYSEASDAPSAEL